MLTENRIAKTNTGYIALTLILLVGILIISYGYFQQSRAALFIGVLVTLAGVINGVFKIVIRAK